MPHRSPALRSLLILLASSALGGCGADAALIATPPTPPDPEPRSEARITVLNVAGSTPDAIVALAPFDCNQGIEVHLSGRRYCMYNSTSTWPGAEARCVEHGGHLATIGTSDLGSSLLQTVGFPPGASNFWIGLAEPAEGRWLWASGAPVSSFSAWNVGEPNNSGGNENCGEWLFPLARWNDLDCATSRAFLCETKSGFRKRRSGSACAREINFGGSTFCLDTGSPTTWEQAQHLCTEAGGNLAVLDTAEKNQAIADALGVRPTQATGSLWLGLNDRAREGDFRWISGEPVGRTAWRAGEPNNVGDEDCTEWSPSDGMWNDLGCDAQRGSLCEGP